MEFSRPYYRGYPGPADDLLDRFVLLVRSENPSDAVGSFLVDRPTSNQLLAAVAAICRFYTRGQLVKTTRDYLEELGRAGTLWEHTPGVLVEVFGSYGENADLHEAIRASAVFDDLEFQVPAIRTLIRWGFYDEAINRVSTIRADPKTAEVRFLLALALASKREYRACINELAELVIQEPEATLLGAFCAARLRDRALESRLVSSLRVVPRTYQKRFDRIATIYRHQGRFFSLVSNAVDAGLWLGKWMQPLAQLEAEIRDRRVALRA